MGKGAYGVAYSGTALYADADGRDPVSAGLTPVVIEVGFRPPISETGAKLCTPAETDLNFLSTELIYENLP